MQYRNPDYHQGIDIANYQAGINFGLVRESGISIVYIKATEGTTYVNPYLRQHYTEAKAQGLKIGFYHYFHVNKDAVAQMLHFYNTISGLEYDCLPALDVEEAKGMTKAEISKATHAGLNEMAYLTKRRPILYTYTSFVRSNLIADQVNMYPLWIADYNSRGVPGSNPIWDTWVGYQYSSSGNIGGIRVDLDEFTDEIFIVGGGTVEDWKINLVERAVAEGLLTESHDPEQMVPLWMVLAIIYNGKAKGVI